ncbi:hypothetical protein IAQ61_002349 [Plenodomus lingam]|uniref:uncharacterized protein n=1 Tax=Leptosphaeria maculans TaxID=5022 RepID=UPI00332593E1|nr:hypothetical protein IAQ61_002349 [Plenodomus lingam]
MGMKAVSHVALHTTIFPGFTYSSLSFLARTSIQWKTPGLEDTAMLATQIASVIQFALLLISLSAGLSKIFGSIS